MATNYWRGDAPAIAKVVTLVVGSTTNGHTFITTMNGKSITYTAGAAETTSTIATAIQALLAASEIAEFKEVTWSVSTATVTGTAATPGVPFTVSKSGTGTYTLTTTTNNSGPSDASVVSNWSTGALPVDTDAVIISGKASDILWGLESLSTPVALASLRIKADYTGQIGLPYYNASGGYVEYRTRQFPVKTTVAVTIGEGEGTGPRLVNIANGLVLDLTVLKTGTRQTSAVPVVNVSGCTSGVLNLVGGDAGVASDDDTLTGTVTTATVGDAGKLVVGKGATVTTLNNDGGSVLAFGTVTTLNQLEGTAVLHGASVTTVTADGGKVDWRGTGTLATATFRGQPGSTSVATLELGNDPRARTITNASFTGGAIINDPDKTSTWSNGFTFDAASLAKSNVGKRLTVTRT